MAEPPRKPAESPAHVTGAGQGRRAHGAEALTYPPDGEILTADQAVGGPGYVVVVAFFALTLVHGPGWDGAQGIRRQRAWDEHAAFMDGLVEQGLIVVGGPVGDGERTLHMVEADDEQEVRRRLGEDPWARMGLLEIGAIEPWAIWLDGRSRHLARRGAAGRA